MLMKLSRIDIRSRPAELVRRASPCRSLHLSKLCLETFETPGFHPCPLLIFVPVLPRAMPILTKSCRATILVTDVRLSAHINTVWFWHEKITLPQVPPMITAEIPFGIEPILLCSRNIPKGPPFGDGVDLQNFDLTQATKDLNICVVKYCPSEKIVVWPQSGLFLVRISYPRQIRKNENLIKREREICLARNESYVRVIEALAEGRLREACSIVNCDGMIGDNELDRRLSGIGDLPDAFRPDRTE